LLLAPKAKVLKGPRPDIPKDPFRDQYDYKPSPPESVVTPERLEPDGRDTDWSEAEKKGIKRKEKIVKKSRKYGELHNISDALGGEGEHQVEPGR
jgi:hypothetical protein